MNSTMTIDGITALERSYAQLASVVAGLDADDLGKPTNCPGVDVRGMLNHTLGVALMCIGVNRGEILGEDAGDVIGNDAAGAVAQLASANVDSWRSPGALEGERVYPFATFPAPWGLVINVGEVAVHAWDLAKATGQPATIDADVAQIVLDFYKQIPMDDLRATGVYGPEFEVPATAPVQDRLLGFLSRQP